MRTVNGIWEIPKITTKITNKFIYYLHFYVYVSQNIFFNLLKFEKFQLGFIISFFFILVIMLSGTFSTLKDISAQQSNSTNIKNGTKPIDFLLYENSTYEIKISYPKNWFVESIPFLYPLTNIATIFSPESGDYVSLRINTYDYSNTQIDTLKELLNDVIDGYSLYLDEFPNFKLNYSSTNKTLAGMPAYIMIGEYEDPDFGQQRVLDIGTLKDDTNYFLQYFASPSLYKHYLPIIDSMIESFEIQDLNNKTAAQQAKTSSWNK